jgi:hypothetical protein
VTQDLLLHGQGAELAVVYFVEVEIAAYLVRRFGVGAVPDVLARMLHQRTGGNPLFLVAVVDNLVQQGVLRQSAMGWELAGELEATATGPVCAGGWNRRVAGRDGGNPLQVPPRSVSTDRL